ncbi:TM2 domain-containing protein [Agreia sp. PsM10]|uniref:TM2 domain-containing protein n=1 Tax=Agreia sp. PsM10 TaxID=3030533 RepID=UPI00263BC15A|nr:TM2 domain-containing protein [Agreia sp. PsM10]MDN4641416.1 TM2 domain-containing protein [Agreia sp. PsM10]
MTDASHATPANLTVNVTAPQAAAPTRRVNKVAYILLNFFFGGIGVHRFMRGQVGLGILYILTAGLFGVGALVDFIISLVKLGSYQTDYYEFSYVPNGHWAAPSQS